MDILSQALNVAEQAEAAGGAATLTFDLRKESHRAAYAAALAVLRIGGVDEDELVERAAGVEGGVGVSAAGGAVPIVTLGSGDEVQLGKAAIRVRIGE